MFEQLTLVRPSPQSMDKVTQFFGAERQAVEAEWLATSQDAAALLRQERESPRMNYPAYRARGYQIGSGTVESGCKQIGTQRLKVPGARKVAEARAASLGQEWEMLVQRRMHLARAA